MAARTAFTAHIKETATNYELDANLLEALILIESNGQSWVSRYEPQFYKRYQLSKRPEFQPDARRWAVSYGLTQLLGATAFDLGFKGDPEGLFHIETNLDWGAYYLSQCFVWAQTFNAPEADTLRAALCAYNGGRNSNTSPLNPRPRNIAYAVRVTKTAQELLQFS